MFAPNREMKDTDKELENNELESNSSTETIESPEDGGSADAAETTDASLTAEEKLRAEAADWKDKYVRLYAEFENFRHRTSREKLALVSTASEGLMKDLLPVIDDFERSLKAMETAPDLTSLKEGVEIIYHKFLLTLTQKGLKPMETVGKPFDADIHEAVTQFPAPTPEQKGMIIDELEKGYALNEKTIRFAKVVIGS
jgi:molecular chaperone GrpE